MQKLHFNKVPGDLYAHEILRSFLQSRVSQSVVQATCVSLTRELINNKDSQAPPQASGTRISAGRVQKRAFNNSLGDDLNPNI